MCIKTVINVRLKKLIARLTQLKKLIPWQLYLLHVFGYEIYANNCCIYVCSEQNNDEQSVNEITSLMNSLAGVISSRLEQLNKAKDCAGKYEETFAAASTALTAARKAQTDADDHVQVIYLHHFSFAK